MPLELWVQAAHHGLRIVELPVPLIYLDEERSFGGSLDDGRKRLEYYHQVLDRADGGRGRSECESPRARRVLRNVRRICKVASDDPRGPPLSLSSESSPANSRSMLMEHAAEFRSLGAPPGDGQTLIDPPSPRCPASSPTIAQLLAAVDYDVQGRIARRTRRQRSPRTRRAGRRLHAPISRRARALARCRFACQRAVHPVRPSAAAVSSRACGTRISCSAGSRASWTASAFIC